MISKKFKSYVDGMMDASDIIISENPNFLVVPMMGSVPFIDVMHLINDDFDSSKAVYMPASSRVTDINNVIKTWYSNFLNDKIILDDPLPKIIGIDEVVSGQSLVRCVNSIDIATGRQKKKLRHSLMGKLFSNNFEKTNEGLQQINDLTNDKYCDTIFEIANNYNNGIYSKTKKRAKDDSTFLRNIVKDTLSKKLVYRSIGIEDDKKHEKRSKEYYSFREKGRVLPVYVDNILTMDKPAFCSAKYKSIKQKDIRNNKYVAFYPEVSHFEITPEYLNFLQNVARYVGKNPNDAVPVNMNVILNSSKYLSNFKQKIY